MASTYVNDLRLNEMATGDASGSWGTVTNTNLELIGEAFSYGTETIGDADSTLTIADGAADAARSFYLKITSSVDLTTTRIVTLGPNTVSKVWMIENATTGSQVITIKQGSGATINVPNGQVKMISTDGAGSGGAVLDLLVDVDLTGTTTLVNLDVSGAVDIAGDLTLSAGGDGALRFTAASSVKVLDNDAAALVFEEADNAYMTFVTTDGSEAVKFDKALDINAATQIDATVTIGVDDTGYDVKFFGATAGAYMLWDESADDLILGGAAGLSVNSAALVTGVLTTTAATVHTGGITMPDNAKAIFGASDLEIYHDGTNNIFAGNIVIDGSDASTSIASPATLNLKAGDANNEYSTLRLATSADGSLAMIGAKATTTGAYPNSVGQLELAVQNGASTNTILTATATGIDVTGNVELSANNSLILNAASTAHTNRINWDYDGTTYAHIGRENSTGDMQFTVQSVERMRIDSSGGLITNPAAGGHAIFNEGGVDADFRVESDGNANMLFVDASTNRVGVGLNAPTRTLHVADSAADPYVLVDGSAGNRDSGFSINAGGGEKIAIRGDAAGSLYYGHANEMLFTTAGAIFNEGGADLDFRVESDTVSDAFTVDGASGTVSVNGSAFRVGNHTGSFNQDGTYISNSSGSFMYMERSGAGNSVMYIHRRTDDGILVEFFQGGTSEGSISVSGTTVSYNGFCGTHDSSGATVSISTPVGTVLSTIDEEHKADHAKVKVSDSVGDKRVYGVLQQYNETTTSDDTKQTTPEHAVVASVGIASVRVTGACEGGDLLESNGDGTAKVQSDDIVRSKTIGKVTIGNSDTGVKLVSCVMYCG
jgi:hypothetical protein